MPTPLSKNQSGRGGDLEMSPNGANTRSDGTPQVAIVEEQDGGESDDSNCGFQRKERRSDFSLSNAADVNPDNGEITPLMRQG